MKPKLLKINRDNDGFATRQSLESMYDSLPICVVRYTPYESVGDVVSVDYIDDTIWHEYVEDILTKPYYKYYFLSPKLC